MAKQKPQRGGYRPGSGRKPKFGERMEQLAVRVPSAVVEMLDSLASTNKSRSEVVLELLAKAHKPIRDALKRK